MPSPTAAISSGGRHAAVLALLCTTLTLLVLVLASLFQGAAPLTAGDVLNGLFARHAPSLESALVWRLRLPRILLAVLVGLQFATAGLILQAVVRNPLADPGVVGISSGAGLAVVALLLVTDLAKADALIGANHASMMVWLPAVALFGGLAAAGLVLGMSWRMRLCPLRLTLNGVAVSAILNALVMWSIVAWGGAHTEIALIWLAGSLYGRDFLHVYVLCPWCLAGVVGALVLLRPLSLLRLDDAVSASLGLRWRATAISVIVVLAASAVAVTGPVGFVGLVTPHWRGLSLSTVSHSPAGIQEHLPGGWLSFHNRRSRQKASAYAGWLLTVVTHIRACLRGSRLVTAKSSGGPWKLPASRTCMTVTSTCFQEMNGNGPRFR